MHQSAESFARRFCALSVRTARRSNRLSVILRRSGEPDDVAQSELFAEMAKVNMREAKQRKQDARMRGEW